MIVVQVDGSFAFIFDDDVTVELDNNDCAFRYDEPPSPGRTEPAKRPGVYTFFVCVVCWKFSQRCCFLLHSVLMSHVLL